jgi:hypothetical protein
MTADPPLPASQRRGTCSSCAHFADDPATLERDMPGLTAMGSAHASVRAADGLCRRHGLYLSGTDSCPSFQRRARPDGASAPA